MTVGPVVIFTALLIYSIYKEPRRFRNAVLLVIDIGLILTAMSLKHSVFSLLAGFGIFLIPVVFFLSAVFLIVNGILILKKESKSLANSLSLLLGLFMIAGSILSVAGMVYLQDVSVWRSLFFLALATECYLAFSFVAFFLYSWLYTYMPKNMNCDYIIVHGCGLMNGETVTPLLKGRVDKAVGIYHKSGKRPKLVVSGGKGNDEKISEAQAMKNYLLENNFPAEDIIMEDKSSTTFENLKNVKEMLDTNGEKHNYIFVTNNYHVFRTGMFARKLKMKAQGVGCRTAAYYWPSAFIREYIAILVKFKWMFGVIVLLWGIIEALIYLT